MRRIYVYGKPGIRARVDLVDPMLKGHGAIAAAPGKKKWKRKVQAANHISLPPMQYVRTHLTHVQVEKIFSLDPLKNKVPADLSIPRQGSVPAMHLFLRRKADLVGGHRRFGDFHIEHKDSRASEELARLKKDTLAAVKAEIADAGAESKVRRAVKAHFKPRTSKEGDALVCASMRCLQFTMPGHQKDFIAHTLPKLGILFRQHFPQNCADALMLLGDFKKYEIFESTYPRAASTWGGIMGHIEEFFAAIVIAKLRGQELLFKYYNYAPLEKDGKPNGLGGAAKFAKVFQPAPNAASIVLVTAGMPMKVEITCDLSVLNGAEPRAESTGLAIEANIMSATAPFTAIRLANFANALHYRLVVEE